MTDALSSLVSGETLTRDAIAQLAASATPVHLLDCDLDEADASRLNLSGWRFERCSLRRTDFDGARIDRAQWTSCRGAFASFAGADLSEAVFANSDFNNALFRGATLVGARFAGCKLTGADLSEARALDLAFEETLLINAKLPAHSFRKQTLHRIDFAQADLRKCDFRATVFEGCSLRDAHMAGSRFEGADLRGADLGGLRLIDAGLFRGATISRDQAGQLLGELGLNVR